MEAGTGATIRTVAGAKTDEKTDTAGGKLVFLGIIDIGKNVRSSVM